MWTHLQPFLDAEPTQISIDRQARVALYRAMNIGRLILMVGSGVSRPYGYPSWSEFSAIFCWITGDLHEEASAQDEFLRERTAQCVRQLRELAPDSGNSSENFPILSASRIDELGANAGSIVDLCEEILRRMGSDPNGDTYEFVARLRFAKLFRASGWPMARARLLAHFPQPWEEKKFRWSETDLDAGSAGSVATPPSPWPEEKAADFDPLSAALARIALAECEPEAVLIEVNRFASHAIATARQAARAATTGGRSLGDPARDPAFYWQKHAAKCDLVDRIVERRRISRWLTLNYDVVFERSLHELRKIGVKDPTFLHLCQAMPTGRDDDHRVTIEDGTSRSLVTSTLTPNNIGELIGFGAFSKQYDRQIFHLHGRHDDPDNMVVTQRDYRRVYVRDEDAASTFDEAREVVFGGNDVLFLGVGMTEDDVLSPYRRFFGRAEREKRADAPRNVFVLMARSDAEDGPVKDALAAIKRYETYGIFTIHYGGDRFKNWSKALGDIVKWLEGKASEEPRNAIALIGAGGDDAVHVLPDERKTLKKLCTDRSKGAFEPQRRLAAIAMVKEIASRVHGRALAIEYDDLRTKASIWWDAWREPPGERRPRANLIEEAVGGHANYLWVRHCPDDAVPPFRDAPRSGEPDMWGPLEEARKIGRMVVDANAASRRRDGAVRPRRRVLRLAIPRGGGAGAFIRLALHADRHSSLFGEEQDHADFREKRTYEGVFAVHLAYAVEFSSVIAALTRFVARRVAKLQIASGKADSAVAAIEEKIAAFGKNAAVDAMPKPVDAEAAFVAGREAEPRLVPHPKLAFEHELPPTVRRPHRIDVLRSVLTEYTSLAGPGERLLVMLSGLDQLCDECGDAHNPVHRAFFRLLGGDGRASEEAPDAPLDLVLISGRPQVPICYLSEEANEPLPPEKERLYARKSQTKRCLRLWSKLPPFGWLERICLVARDPAIQKVFLARLVAERGAEPAVSTRNWMDLLLPFSGPGLRRALLFHRWVMQIDADPTRRVINTYPQRSLIRLLWDNLALTQWVLLAWLRGSEEDVVRSAGSSPTASVVSREIVANRLTDFVEHLDRAGARDGFRGCVDVVLALHRKYDEPGPAQIGTADRELIALLLHHLTLFTVPIEPIVLHDCPMIRRRLCELDPSDRTTPETAAQEAAALERRLTHLDTHLRELESRGLVVPVKPASVLRDPSFGAVDVFEGEARFHRRYALHSRLREHLSQKMRLKVSDRGDRAHHQISIACDQPRDLPSPSGDHFGMVREVLRSQIFECRRQIAPAYRFSARGARMTPDDPDPVTDPTKATRTARAAEVIVETLFRPTDLSADAMTAGHWQIHALSHRIRGAYGLLRGAFSVGAITRLDIDESGGSPFEDYNDWLRSLLNLAVGIEINSYEIGLALNGELARLVKKAGATLSADSSVDLDIDARMPFADFVRWEGPRSEADVSPAEIERRREALKALAKAYSSRTTGAAAPADRLVARTGSYSTLINPLYRDEIAWLYNERGVTALIQGRIFDAMPSFERARFVVTHSPVVPESDTHAHHAVERRILLNTAVAEIERGNIERAREILRRLDQSSGHVEHSTPSLTGDFARAYLALCDHLSGSLARAESGYEAAIDIFNKRRRLRAVSIFGRHYAELLRRRGKLSDARFQAELAISAAAQAEQRDILHLAEITLANIEIAQGKLDAAQPRIEQARLYGDRMSLFGVQATALLSRANLLMRRGEHSRAGSAAARAVAIGVRNGLGLIKLHGLELLGEALRYRGQTEVAQMVLQETKNESERLHYQLRSERAAARLSEIESRSQVDR